MVNTRSKTLKTCISQPSIENSEHQSTHPEALVGSNDDLLTEILLRLSVASIIRFKSVCKHWRWLLSHRHFTHRYDKLSRTPGLFVKHIYGPFDVQSHSPLGSHTLESYFNRDVIISQSCNGLLLCHEFVHDMSIDRKYYVFNPTTKQLATIPSVLGGHHSLSISLAFHQTECGHFKIVWVRVLYEAKQRSTQVQVYSSDAGTWKISVESFQSNGYNFGKGVYYNGSIYWPPSRGNLLCFDIDVAQMQTLPLPSPMDRHNFGFKTYMGESRGHLHLIEGENLGDNANLHLKVYEMLRDRSGWFVKYQLEFDDLCCAYRRMMLTNTCYNFSVIDVVRGEKEEDTFIVLKTNGENIITYNVLDKSFKHIYVIPRHRIYYFSSFYRYTEALTYF